MILNGTGQIVYDSWVWLEKQYAYVHLDEFIVMPNHMHGIIFLTDMGNDTIEGASRDEGASRGAPTGRKPLGQLIGAFKTISTKQINMVRHTPGIRLWQRNYCEHVIRNDIDLARVREYIVNNPSNGERDEYNFRHMRGQVDEKCPLKCPNPPPTAWA